ncbi:MULTISPECIES: hypothetical protein [Halorubrum]|uniref:Uncharacterized protein n=1 Tax=Halorubrum hochstenium ATCC 700873 TaxID=1227481 RepID=M0F9X5_9EURY|nr:MULTISPECIES: hypothetical protein [Halorubrum]ELZ56755.1 hypothetical protein C467_07777 [Halorubrum hochstenium ATCC 700873]
MSDSLTIRRPIARFTDGDRVAACPRCKESVEGSLGAPQLSTMRLANQWSGRVDGDTICVRGYRCGACGYVLAIGPGDASVDVGSSRDHEGESWVSIGAVFADGSQRPVVVPAREVFA